MSMTEGKNLVIVESPGKIKKIEDALGKDYIVKASWGHIRDLDESGLSINIEKGFEPQYVIPAEKGRYRTQESRQRGFCCMARIRCRPRGRGYFMAPFRDSRTQERKDQTYCFPGDYQVCHSRSSREPTRNRHEPRQRSAGAPSA